MPSYGAVTNGGKRVPRRVAGAGPAPRVARVTGGGGVPKVAGPRPTVAGRKIRG
jgi:hypothetical protein